jgi:Zn-dependent protease with chaperone function
VRKTAILWALWALLLVLALGWAARAEAQQENPAGTMTDSPLNAPTLNQDQGRALPLVTRYTLPPEKYAKAQRLNQIGYVGRPIAPIYQILILFLILGGGWSARFRNLAERVSSNWLVQGAIYVAVAMFVVSLLILPLDAAEHSVYRHYGLSIQGWDSWLWDKVKELMVGVIVGSVVVWGLVAAIRRSPSRWWVTAWMGAVCFTAVLEFLAPVVIDPLFNKFEPLALHDAPLTQALERVVDRAGLTIPVDRMYWMAASEKVRTMNAYVTGLGASKRVVVWDTTIANATTPEILFVFGHELGHYVLGHIPKQLGILAAIFLVLFYVGFKGSMALLRRRGAGWGIRGADDFAAMPVYFAVLLVLMLLCTPLLNAMSRHYEHQADQYGLEITHGLTPDSGEVAARSFQLLGEMNLEDPAPTRWEIFWYYDHPWIGDRIRFSLEYDPWVAGGTGEFVK